MPDGSRRVDRREFLRGAGGALLGALLSGCGVRGARQPSPAAPATAAPAASRPPAPLASSEPPLPGGRGPTPFPPGPASKLGLFVAWYHPQVMELVATGGVALLKTLEFDPAFLAEVRARSPRTLIVGRPVLENAVLGADPAAEARRAVEPVLSLAADPRRAGLVDAWEGLNEPPAGDGEQVGWLAELEVERVRLLAEVGLRAVAGNFGTGTPPLECWPAFRPALEAARAHGGFLGLHEYSAPTMWTKTTRLPPDMGAAAEDEGWLTLRYRKVYREHLLRWGMELPLLITECGVDGLVANRPGPPGGGWQDFGAYWAELGMGTDAAGTYVEQLAWYDSQLRLDDFVAGAAIFAMTAYEEWHSYQILGEAADILRRYLAVHPVR